MRPNSPNAAGESPDSADHNDAAFGTAGIDGHDRPSATASWQGAREVGLEGAATTRPWSRVEFSTERVQPQEMHTASSEKPRTTTAAAAAVTAEVNGRRRIYDPDKENVEGSATQPAQPAQLAQLAQPAQPMQQRGKDFVVAAESVEVEGEKAEAGEPLLAGGEAGEFTDLDAGAFAESYERGKWLLGLLVLQSTSSSVLDKYQVR